MTKYRLICALLCVAVLIWGATWHAGAIKAQNSVRLQLGSASEKTFRFDNLKPGDEACSSLKLYNAAGRPLMYEIRSRLDKGDRMLYEIMDIALRISNRVLYNGKLTGADGLLVRGQLQADEEVELEISAFIPAEAGNEYQAKTAVIVLEFSVTEHTEEPEPGSGSPAAGGGGSPTPSPALTPTPFIATPGASVSREPYVSPEATPARNGGVLPGELPVQEEELPMGDGESLGLPGGQWDVPSAAPYPTESFTLPDTATPWYNLLLISSISILACAAILLKRRQ
ncbi:MAG: hypothetical protein K0Q90_2325 [Paenibacillaceae bacterium]|jgi:hypothetical protein|nr:hypothetical protein [Paenibacillaceae bacterium]